MLAPAMLVLVSICRLTTRVATQEIPSEHWTDNIDCLTAIGCLVYHRPVNMMLMVVYDGDGGSDGRRIWGSRTGAGGWQYAAGDEERRANNQRPGRLGERGREREGGKVSLHMGCWSLFFTFPLFLHFFMFYLSFLLTAGFHIYLHPAIHLLQTKSTNLL